MERKLAGPEKGVLPAASQTFHEREFERLRGVLEDAYRDSQLPERPSGKESLNDLLIRLRLQWRLAKFEVPW